MLENTLEDFAKEAAGQSINTLKGFVKKIVEEKLLWGLYMEPESFEAHREKFLACLLSLQQSLLKKKFDISSDDNWVGGLTLLISDLWDYNPECNRDEYASQLTYTAGLLIEGYRDPEDTSCPSCKSSDSKLSEREWEARIHPRNYLERVKGMAALEAKNEVNDVSGFVSFYTYN